MQNHLKAAGALALLCLSGQTHPGPAAPAQPSIGARLSGTWRFVPAASQFTSGQPIRSETRVYRVQGDRVQVVATGIDGAGKPTRYSYTAAYDGRYYPLVGSPLGNLIALRQVDARTIEATVMRGKAISARATLTVAPNGRRFVMTRRIVRPTGTPAVDELSYARVG